MGSNEALPPTAGFNENDEITILVTGFGPFKAQYPVNPSWEIVKSLPPLISLSSFSSSPQPTSSSSSSTTALGPQIRLIVYPSPVKVAYATVRELVPKLWSSEQGRMIDFCVHVGMAGERERYALERRGHRSGYWMRDVDGVILGDESKKGRWNISREEKSDREGEGWIWKDCPEELVTDVDVDDVWRRWKGALPVREKSC